MKKKQRNTNKKPFRLRFTTRLLLAVIVLSPGINGYYVYDIFGRPIREARAEAQKGMTKEQLEVQKRRDAQEKAENEKHIEGKIHYESADGRIGYEDGLILNSGDAMEALAVLQGQLGIHNAREEYRCERENVSKNRTFYKMQQVCNGIPVYGYNLLIAVNEKGNLLSIDGAYADVQEVNTDTKISSSDAEKLVRNYIKSETDAQKDPDPEEEEDSYRPEVQGTVVFLENGKPVIGYQVQVFMQGINDPVEELVINANTGDILKDTAKMRFEMVTGDLQGQEVNQTLQYWKENADTYQLRDVDKNMRVCKATKNTIKKLDKHSELIEWESPNTNPNAIGVDALANFQRISNYYRAAYGRNGIENNLNAELQIIVDVKKIKLGKETFNLQNNAGMCGTSLSVPEK